jgi:hypothetical protein
MYGAKLTKGITIPVSFQQIVFSGNGIMPNQPEPDLDFQRDFAFPQMPEGSIHSISTNMLVHTFYSELPIFCPFPLWLIYTVRHTPLIQNVHQPTPLYLQIFR